MSEGLGKDATPARWFDHGSWRLALPAIAFGIAADLLVRGPIGVGLSVMAVAASAAVYVVARPRLVAVPFLLAAPVFTGFAIVRASPPLMLLDFVACVGLLALGASYARTGHPLATGVAGYVRRGVGVVRALPAGVAAPAAPFVRAAGTGPRVDRLPRLVAIVAPVLVLFLVLLGSADAVFAHYLRTSLGVVPTPSAWPLQVAFVLAGTVGLATLLTYAGRDTRTEPSASETGRSTLRRTEWVSLLAGVDLVFLAFVVIQITYLFGGRTLILREEALTYAAYARTGFVQLLVASLLTASLVAIAWRLGRREARIDDRLFSWLAGALVLLTLAVLVSAFRRLSLYESAYGWTWPRLLGHAVVVCLGLSLLCGLAWIVRRRGRWLVTAVLVAGLVTLLGLNLVDPERFIAERNLARFDATGEIDAWELGTLSGDATPLIVAALGRLPGPAQRHLRQVLACEQEDLASGTAGLGSWNLARSRAADALASVDVGACPHSERDMPATQAVNDERGHQP